MITLYTLLNEFKPKEYIEIGSGNSTKVARKSINDNDLVLSAFIIANSTKYQPIFPCIFVSEDPHLSNLLDPIWQSDNTINV